MTIYFYYCRIPWH